MFTPEIFVVAFEHLFVSWGIIAIAVGLTAGVVIGAVPGLTAPMGVALVLPFTFFMDPVSAILLIAFHQLLRVPPSSSLVHFDLMETK